jgi:3-hydroxy acid dehydrogenase/malonic semialdehyde reductase
MSGPLSGTTVIVTGASSGIGRALALQLVQAGARVIAAARSEEKLRALAAETGRALIPVETDVRDDASVEALARAAAATGTVHAVVNNAGIGYLESFVTAPVQHWSETIEVNLVGALRVARAFLPRMLEQGAGVIVNVGSNGASGWPYLALYAATKAALDAATLAIDRECAGRGVRLVSVDIGPTRGTAFGERFTDAELLATATAAWTRLGIGWDQFVTADVSARRILDAILRHLGSPRIER